MHALFFRKDTAFLYFGIKFKCRVPLPRCTSFFFWQCLIADGVYSTWWINVVCVSLKRMVALLLSAVFHHDRVAYLLTYLQNNGIKKLFLGAIFYEIACIAAALTHSQKESPWAEETSQSKLFRISISTHSAVLHKTSPQNSEEICYFAHILKNACCNSVKYEFLVDR